MSQVYLKYIFIITYKDVFLCTKISCTRNYLSVLTPHYLYVQVIDDPKNRKIFLVQELMEGGALMPDSERCDAMPNEVCMC